MITRIVPIFAVLLLGCAGPQRSAILEVLDAQVNAWNAGSVDGYMEGYWKSEAVTFVSGGSVTKGYEVVRDRYRRNYSTPERMGTLSFGDIELVVLSSSSALITGQWRLKRPSDEPWGRFTLLFEKKSEGWKIVYDHTSLARE